MSRAGCIGEGKHFFTVFCTKQRQMKTGGEALADALMASAQEQGHGQGYSRPMSPRRQSKEGGCLNFQCFKVKGRI